MARNLAGGRDAPGLAASPDGGDGEGTWSLPYVRARSLEGRLYPDSTVARLPNVPPSHPLAAEWRARADSSERLVAYLRRLTVPPIAIDVGCGNGWLANRIAEIEGSEVVGLDGNGLEVRQAARVFRGPNLRFVVGDATVVPSSVVAPTVIVVASTIQYVADLPAFMRRLLGWLAPGGELHVLDSPLYLQPELAGARERTRSHYERLGVPEMIGLYHHHTWAELEGFDYEVLYRPGGLRGRVERRLLGRTRSPFPWLRVRPAAPA